MLFRSLLRWKHPQHGVITPANFLPLIEHTELSVSVGDWVLQQGLEQLARWQRLGLDITVSVTSRRVTSRSRTSRSGWRPCSSATVPRSRSV